MNVILSGLQNSGKTSVGRRLAEELECPFHDIDWIIDEREEQSYKEIMAVGGEEHFRKIEKEALFSLEGVQDSVIALGGGTLLDSDNREFIKNLGLLMYLDDSRKKPPHQEKRRTLYEQSADLIVDADKEIEEIVQWLVIHLERIFGLRRGVSLTGK